jgi:excisionase family DNA binding protein
MQMKSELMTLQELADLFRVSRQTILNWQEAGRFPSPIRISRRYVRWLRSDVRQFLEDLKSESHNETCRR